MKKTIKFVGILMFIFFLTGCKDHAHELIHINPKEATCMEEGIVEHWKCKTCEKCFLDEQGKTEMKDITIKKLVHNFDMNNIKWEWSEDNEEAVAILTCENGETHQERIQAVVTNEETIEAITYTATITYNNVTYTYTNTKQNLFSLAYELSQDKTSYIVTGRGTYKGTNIAIPSEYNGLPVISIGDNTFAGCSSLTSITLPDSVTSIGERAFYKCSSLTSLYLPDSLCETGNFSEAVFTGCTSFAKLDTNQIPVAKVYVSEAYVEKVKEIIAKYTMFNDFTDEQLSRLVVKK